MKDKARDLPLQPCQLRDVHAKEPTQPAVVRQQSLREVGHGLSYAAGVENDGEKLSVAQHCRPAQFQLLARAFVRRHLAQHQPVARWLGTILVTVTHGISFAIVESAWDQHTETNPGPRPAAIG